MDSFSSLSRRVFLQSLAWSGAGAIVSGATSLPTLPTVDEELRAAAKAPPLRLPFQGRTAADLVAWQNEFSTELRKRLGPHRPPERWSVKSLSRIEFSDYVREESLLSADGVPSLPLYVLKPAGRGATGPFPIIVALHGHGAFGHDAVVGIDDTPERAKDIREQNYDYGRQLVREGYVVVAPCLTPFGRRLDGSYRKSTALDPCATTFARMMLLGQTLIGANLRDVSWALSHAQTLPEARRNRVGCVGLSLGGRMTMLASALDKRIAVAVVSGALNVMQERMEGHYGCGAQIIPGLLELGDTPEIGSLIAPRPSIWEIGSTDRLVNPRWADVAKRRLGAAYVAAGKPEELQFHLFEGGHRWDGKTAIPLLARVLKRA